MEVAMAEKPTRLKSLGDEAQCINNLPEQILECIFGRLESSGDRGSASEVCKMWQKVDGLTRRSVYISNCYSIAPTDLSTRFKSLLKIKIKGKPRAYEFGLLVDNWGGHAGPWIEEIGKAYPMLQSLHLRRMDVTDEDLALLATKCRKLNKLKLNKCCGFSTRGLQYISEFCRGLRVIDLEESDEMEDDGGPWLQLLRNGEGALESLNLASAGLGEEENIKQSLQVLAPRLKMLSSLKVSDMELDSFFQLLEHSMVPVLQLGLGCYSSRPEEPKELAASFSHRLAVLRVLDLKFATMSAEIQIELLRHCNSLEELEGCVAFRRANLTERALWVDDWLVACVVGAPVAKGRTVLELRSAVGDWGMQVIGDSCKRLKRIRVDHINSEYMADYVTQKGMIAICEGCRELDFLVLYLSDVNNEALAAVGRCLPKLTDFRIVLLDKLSIVEGLPLDDGVRSLLQGCPLLTRFSVYLRNGGLTDRGVGYIGEFGAKLKWVLLGCSGDSDEGMRLMADGCRQLERLELRGCPFGEAVLASSVLTMMTRLKYLWVQGVGATSALGATLVTQKPGFLVEFVAERSQLLGYYTVASPRKDNPPSVCLIYPKQEYQEQHEEEREEPFVPANVDFAAARYTSEYVESYNAACGGYLPGDLNHYSDLRVLEDGESVYYNGVGDPRMYLGFEDHGEYADCGDDGAFIYR